ncbi:MAG: hypothetical protein AB8C84_10625 [Oligoflexales bacterium]
MKTLSFKSVLFSIFIITGILISIVSQFAEKPNIYLQGTVQLAPELVKHASHIQTLFVVLYDAESKRPMPWAAIKFKLRYPAQAGVFHHFVLTPENLQIMDANSPVPKTFRAKARLDVNGQGGMATPGDLVGELLLAPRGSTTASIIINQKVGTES